MNITAMKPMRSVCIAAIILLFLGCGTSTKPYPQPLERARATYLTCSFLRDDKNRKFILFELSNPFGTSVDVRSSDLPWSRTAIDLSIDRTTSVDAPPIRERVMINDSFSSVKLATGAAIRQKVPLDALFEYPDHSRVHWIDEVRTRGLVIHWKYQLRTIDGKVARPVSGIVRIQ
jgi:hypothetical protein